MLQDRDPQVVANCVIALEEVWCSCRGSHFRASDICPLFADLGGRRRAAADKGDCLHTLEPAQGQGAQPSRPQPGNSTFSFSFPHTQDFTDWNQCAIMSVLVRYAPSDEDEVFDILNLLDERLKHSNTGVVLVSAVGDASVDQLTSRWFFYSSSGRLPPVPASDPRHARHARRHL